MSLAKQYEWSKALSCHPGSDSLGYQRIKSWIATRSRGTYVCFDLVCKPTRCPGLMGQYRTGLLLSQSILDGLNRLHRLPAVQTLVGDDRSGATPDPIPNSEVKPGPPMILLSGKVGHCRQFGPASGNAGGATLCAHCFRFRPQPHCFMPQLHFLAGLHSI